MPAPLIFEPQDDDALLHAIDRAYQIGGMAIHGLETNKHDYVDALRVPMKVNDTKARCFISSVTIDIASRSFSASAVIMPGTEEVGDIYHVSITRRADLWLINLVSVEEAN